MVEKDWTDGWPDGNAQVPGWSGEDDSDWPDLVAQKRIKQIRAFFVVLFLILILGVIRAYM